MLVIHWIRGGPSSPAGLDAVSVAQSGRFFSHARANRSLTEVPPVRHVYADIADDSPFRRVER